MQQSKLVQRMTYAFGISMAILMAVTLFLPGLTNNQQSSTQADPPTATPPPTAPPPITDFSTITFDESYVHPSGLYSVDVPSGWEPIQPTNNGLQVKSVLVNDDALSRVEVYIEKPIQPISTVEEVEAQISEAALRSSWVGYPRGVEQLSQRTEGDRVLVDFALIDSQFREFVARHVTWTDGTYIYVVRVAVPDNASELLFFMLEEMVDRIHPNMQFVDTPLAWNGYIDESAGYILRYPTEWQLTDGGNGQPTSFESLDGLKVRVETQADAVADEDAVSEWITTQVAEAEVLSVEAVNREGDEGFAVAYQYETADGERLSGYALLLNDADGQLHVVNAMLPAADIDLNTEDGQAMYADVFDALRTFAPFES